MRIEREEFYSSIKLPEGFEAYRYNGMNRVHFKYKSIGFAVIDMKKYSYNLATREEYLTAIGRNDYELTDNLGPNHAIVRDIDNDNTRLLEELIIYISTIKIGNDNYVRQPREYKEWIIPCNIDLYRLHDALVSLKKIDWSQSRQMKNAKIGDFVYIYCTGKRITNCICYKGAILEVNKYDDIIDDSDYSLDHMKSTGPCFTIAVFREFDAIEDLTYPKLKAAGLKTKMMGPLMVKGELARYLHRCDELQRNIDRFDGVIRDTCNREWPQGLILTENLNDLSWPEALDDTHSYDEKEVHASTLSMADLRLIAEEQSKRKTKKSTVTILRRERSPYIAQYAKRRAKGICQLCGAYAPFNTPDGKPYLESHHIIWLSKGGDDSIDNTVALCPNCHKKMHVLNDSTDIEKLKSINDGTHIY